MPSFADEDCISCNCFYYLFFKKTAMITNWVKIKYNFKHIYDAQLRKGETENQERKYNYDKLYENIDLRWIKLN